MVASPSSVSGRGLGARMGVVSVDTVNLTGGTGDVSRPRSEARRDGDTVPTNGTSSFKAEALRACIKLFLRSLISCESEVMVLSKCCFT